MPMAQGRWLRPKEVSCYLEKVFTEDPLPDKGGGRATARSCRPTS